MSGFSRKQTEALEQPLCARHVKSRAVHGRTLNYIEGWFAVAEANAIFGFSGWDREVLQFERLFERRQTDQTTCGYLARVRIRVRAGGAMVLREGTGFGSASLADPAEAHELALKSAETDATKRALATFGDRFGLGLYDKDRNAAGEATTGNGKPKFSLRNESSAVLVEDLSAESFCTGLRQLIANSADVETLIRIFAANRECVRTLRGAAPDLRSNKGEHYVEVLKRLFVKRREVLARAPTAKVDLHDGAVEPAAFANVTVIGPPRTSRIGSGTAIEKSTLPIATEYRARDKAHLRMVAAEPCLICSQYPCQAHHLKFAQPKGLSQKVSDEFTVPLCVEHHNALHRASNERTWWHEQGIDPLPLAQRLWERSRHAAAPRVEESRSTDRGVA